MKNTLPKGELVLKSRRNDIINLHGEALNTGSKKQFGLVIASCSNLTLRGLNISEFKRYGVYVVDCKNIFIEDSDISHNFDDPEVAWLGDDRESRGYEDGWGGGIYFRNVQGGAIRGVILGNQFNGIDLVACEGIEVSDNPITPVSNWAIHLLRSSRNNLLRNNCAKAIRFTDRFAKDTADSAAILLEVASHGNHVERNDCRESGDGIFIRSQAPERIPSNNNVLVENDCSFSPNNAIEVIAAVGTKLIRNKANNSNYGMWLDLSTELSLIENEVMENSNEGIHLKSGSFKEFRKNRIRKNPSGVVLIETDASPIDPSNTFEENGSNIVNAKELPPDNTEIVITTPNEGQTIGIGSVCLLSWHAPGITQGEFHINYRVDGINNQGYPWVLIGVVPEIQKSYEWSVPQTLSPGKIILSVGNVLDGQFTAFGTRVVELTHKKGSK